VILISKYCVYMICLKVGFQAHQQAIHYLAVIEVVLLSYILCNIDDSHFCFLCLHVSIWHFLWVSIEIS
jgi:hypothetical protein